MTNNTVVELIEKNRKSKETFLDLGNCDLNDNSSELSILAKSTHLKSLSLGTEYYSNDMLQVNTENKGRENVFTTIPKYLPPGLEQLQIRNAGIKIIANTEKLTRLTLLDLSLNSIERIEKLDNLTSLTELALHGNYIRKIEKLNKLQNLEILHLTRNHITQIENLDRLKNLQQLFLSNNEIRKIEKLRSLTQLSLLDLNKNQIEVIEGLETLLNLTWLSLSDNNITALNNLGKQVILTSLVVANNKILKIEPGLPKSLSILDLRKNMLEDIESLTGLNNLEHLSLDNNKIKRVEPILKLKRLKSVYLNNNEIEDCPADIWQTNDLKQIKAHFDTKFLTLRQKRPGQATPENLSKDVKLILLGNSNTGKSNLVHYLKEGTFLKTRNSTHGMEVIRWEPDKKRFPLLKDVVVNIWDFGGQEYYHEAYKLFMSENAVYVVVWDKASNANTHFVVNITETEKQDIEFFERTYWLDTVRYYGENKDAAPLLLVQNKTDDQANDKIRVSQQFFDQYKLTESYHISLLEGCKAGNLQQNRILENFERELEAILVKAADKEHTNESWQLVRKEILAYQQGINVKKNAFASLKLYDNTWIRKKDFDDACKKFIKQHNLPLSEHDLHTLPRWLDKTGVLVFFDENQSLEDKVFINPKTLSQSIYDILTREVYSNKGEFFLDKKDKRQNIKLAFIEITKRLGLIFEHPVKAGCYIAPQYLPKEHAIEDLFRIASASTWQDSFWVKVPLFYYKKLLHHLIINGGSKTQARYFWKHGIVYLKDGLRVLIKGLLHESDSGEGIILIGVQEGPNKKEIQKEIFQVIFDYEKDKKSNLVTPLPPGSPATVTRDLADSSIEEGAFIKNIQLSYDNETYVTIEKLKQFSNMAGQFFIDDNTKSRLSLHRFSHILPFAVKTRMPKKIFVSYSHQNTRWLNKLRVHLSGLKRNGEVEDWTDQEILAGEKWDKKIKENMEQADVFICLLSADFVASDYIWNTELSAVFNKLKNNNKQIVFIYVEPFDILSLNGSISNDELTSISILDTEIIPKDENGHLKAVSLWQNENQALAVVVKRIREAIR